MIVLYVLLAVVALWYFFSTQKRHKGKPVPGPRGLPIVGSGFDTGAEALHLKLGEYADTYGDIVKVKNFQDTLICLNSAEFVRSAFNDDPFKKYMNDRFTTFWGQNILHNSESIGFYPGIFDGVHSGLRKGFTKALHVYGDGIKDFEDRVLIELHRLEKAIDQKGGQDFDFVAVIKRSLTNLVSFFLNGEKLDDDDPDLNMFWQLDSVNEQMLNTTTNTRLLAFPFLVKFPGFYRRLYTDSVEARERILRRFFYKLRETHQPGVVRGIVDFMLDEQAREREAGGQIIFNDERIKNTIMETIAAAILTTLSALTNTMLCLVNNPECQEKIQKELDEVMGADRDPTNEHRGKCPYLEASLIESSRLIPITPLGLSHGCSADVEFHGYHVPAGSLIIPNVWYIHHNKAVWGDPWKFRPERWLDESGDVIPSTHPLRKHWLTFGTGRRQCIGEQFGRNRLFLYAASLLKNYKFTATPGKCGPCDPRTRDAFDISLIMRTKAFYCRAERRC